MTDEEKLIVLRIQLYAAAQTLKGEQLAALTELIREIAAVLDIVPLSMIGARASQ